MIDANWIIVASLVPVILLGLHQAGLATRVVRAGYHSAERIDRWLSG